MAITVKAGSANYAIAISTDKTGTPLPDGDVVYLFAEKVKVSYRSTDKRKILAHQKQKKIISGKMDCNVNIVNCTIGKEVTASSTLEANAIIGQFNDWGLKQGSMKVYLWIFNIADGAYLQHALASDGGQDAYMEGNIGSFDIEMGKGKLFKIPMLLFQQVN